MKNKYMKKHSSIKRTTAPLFKNLSTVGNLLYPNRNKLPIIISGSPRGGTTWIAETVAKTFHSNRVLWEPLQDGNIEKAGLNLSKRPSINEINITPDIEKFLSSLLYAKQANSHLLRLRKYPLNVIHFLSNKRFIIKFVRGNGVVGYLRRQFDIPKPLVIIRHPCAVVASQLRMGQWEDHPHIDPDLLKRKPELGEIIDYKASLAERLAMTWCGDVLAAKENALDLNIVYYEDVVVNGAETLREAFESWGCESLPQSLYQVIGRPSSTTHEWANLDSVEGKLGRWKEELDEKTVKNILHITHYLGIDEYTENLLPKYSENLE